MDINELEARISVAEYIAAQAFATALQFHPDPHTYLSQSAEMFVNSLERSDASQRNRALVQEAAERLFTSIKASIG